MMPPPTIQEARWKKVFCAATNGEFEEDAIYQRTFSLTFVNMLFIDILAQLFLINQSFK